MKTRKYIVTMKPDDTGHSARIETRASTADQAGRQVADYLNAPLSAVQKAVRPYLTRKWILEQKRAGYSTDNILPTACAYIGIYHLVTGSKGTTAERRREEQIRQRIRDTTL